MLKREVQDYILHWVNLYHWELSAGLSQHINTSGYIIKSKFQELPTKGVKEINSKQSKKISEYSTNSKLITELLPVGALLQPKNHLYTGSVQSFNKRIFK